MPPPDTSRASSTTVTAGAPEIWAIVEDLFSMDGMHDISRFRGDDAEFQRRITKLMDSVACLGADTRTRPGAHEPVSLQGLEKNI